MDLESLLTCAGFIVVVSDTIKCGAAFTAEKPHEKGPEADLFAAAHVMSEVYRYIPI